MADTALVAAAERQLAEVRQLVASVDGLATSLAHDHDELERLQDAVGRLADSAAQSCAYIARAMAEGAAAQAEVVARLSAIREAETTPLALRPARTSIPRPAAAPVTPRALSAPAVAAPPVARGRHAALWQDAAAEVVLPEELLADPSPAGASPPAQHGVQSRRSTERTVVPEDRTKE